MTREESVAAILKAKKAKALSWEKIAEKVGAHTVFVTSALLGQSSLPAEMAEKVVKILALESDVAEVLQESPLKGSLGTTVSADPLIYRFHEITQVYGTTMKAIIHEKFGDGIMSAIDFEIDIQKQEDPKGDRVVITYNGKFLPYRRW